MTSTRNLERTALLRIRHALLPALLALGCAGTQATNVPIERVDRSTGYRPAVLHRERDIGDVGLMVSFSGGGTRAAALAYGVMLELRDTAIRTGGNAERMLDQIDIITSVSGGSFTAAYYGLYGDRLFEDFEARFLRRDVQGDILWRLLIPHNWVRLVSPFYDRSDIAIDYYDRKIFDGATFADLASAGGPTIQVNSTDLSAGARFVFMQDQFDVICSDLSQVRVAEAVTASSAVPVAFPAIVLENFAGKCGYEEPSWIKEALGQRKEDPRRFHIASEMSAYTVREEHPYLHLVDGGIADNLGVRGPLDSIIVGGGIWDRFVQLGEKPPEKLVFIVVNSATEPARPFRFVPQPPPLLDIIGSVTDTQLHRFNFETMALLDKSMSQWASGLEAHGNPVESYLVDIAQYDITDEEDRKFFNNVPTSLSLDGETVDRLIEIGRRLLRESPEYQRLVAGLQ